MLPHHLTPLLFATLLCHIFTFLVFSRRARRSLSTDWTSVDRKTEKNPRKGKGKENLQSKSKLQ